MKELGDVRHRQHSGTYARPHLAETCPLRTHPSDRKGQVLEDLGSTRRRGSNGTGSDLRVRSGQGGVQVQVQVQVQCRCTAGACSILGGCNE